MEFTPLQIAKLVLGYLKKEECDATVLTFCDASPQIKHFLETIRNRSKFITRVNGLSLVDFLTEYAVISTLVQERLENTDYFKERRSKNLVDELRYLLDANGRQNRENSPTQSRSSTPMRELHKERERLYFPENLSVIKKASACDTTPLKSLPGNSNDGAPNKVLRCTTPSSPPRSRKSDENGESDSEDSPDKSLELEEDDLSMQMLTQTLLEHHELHEKIAENINLFRSTTGAAAPVASTEERISSGVSQELDSAIKAIVQKTEAELQSEEKRKEVAGLEKLQSNVCKSLGIEAQPLSAESLQTKKENAGLKSASPKLQVHNKTVVRRYSRHSYDRKKRVEKLRRISNTLRKKKTPETSSNTTYKDFEKEMSSKQACSTFHADQSPEVLAVPLSEITNACNTPKTLKRKPKDKGQTPKAELKPGQAKLQF